MPISLLAVVLHLVAAAFQATSPDINVTAFANGALIESSTSEYGGGWQSRWLTDENPATGWCTEQGAKGPFSIVISLLERSELHTIEFDAASTETEARAASDIDVSISDTSATTGFSTIATVALKAGADRQRFPLARPATGRWIKLTITANHGDPDYTELMEFRAAGRPLTHSELPAALSGTYHSPTFDDFHLQQDGAVLAGCYEHHNGVFQGGAESHLLRLTWREGDRTGPALMVLKRDGKGFEGWWAEGDAPSKWMSGWDLTKASDDIGSCPTWSPKAATANVVAASLAADGRVRLYGINFDTASDRLRPDATPAVDQLLAALKSNPGWSVSIEGHTDSTGDAARNLTLSDLRAKAVKAALVAGGITADRLVTSGLGQTRPVASNDTELGRAQNRRVEVARR